MSNTIQTGRIIGMKLIIVPRQNNLNEIISSTKFKYKLVSLI